MSRYFSRHLGSFSKYLGSCSKYLGTSRSHVCSPFSARCPNIYFRQVGNLSLNWQQVQQGNSPRRWNFEISSYIYYILLNFYECDILVAFVEVINAWGREGRWGDWSRHVRSHPSVRAPHLLQLKLQPTVARKSQRQSNNCRFSPARNHISIQQRWSQIRRYLVLRVVILHESPSAIYCCCWWCS